MKEIAWDYEEGANPPYYHVYGEMPYGWEALTFELTETEQNSDDIQAITDAMDRIANRAKP